MRGATAAVMDNDVTDVLEEQINTISGIESLSSSSYMGAAVTVIEFDMERDIDAAAADVRDKVNAAKANLPSEADEPLISKLDINDSPVVMFSVTGPAPYRDKVYFVDKVAKVKLEIVFLLLAALRPVKMAQQIHTQLHSQTAIPRHLKLLMVPLVKLAQMVVMVIHQSSQLVRMATGLLMVLILAHLLKVHKVKQVQMVMVLVALLLQMPPRQKPHTVLSSLMVVTMTTQWLMVLTVKMVLTAHV